EDRGPWDTRLADLVRSFPNRRRRRHSRRRTLCRERRGARGAAGQRERTARGGGFARDPAPGRRVAAPANGGAARDRLNRDGESARSPKRIWIGQAVARGRPTDAGPGQCPSAARGPPVSRVVRAPRARYNGGGGNGDADGGPHRDAREPDIERLLLAHERVDRGVPDAVR